jgi:hypothetical protein
MLMLVTMTMALLALGCAVVVRQAVRAEDVPADFMGYGDRPLPKKSAAAATTVARKPGSSTVTLKVPDPKCACEFARLIAGKTYEPEAAPKLPLAGCGVIECRCRFVATTDRRGKVRREKEERRDMIRFETKSGRREVGGDRRKSNTRWTGPR